MVIELRHLRLVAAVAEHGSLTRASKQIHLTQSALSHQLLEMEARLGTPVFHRMGKRMVLTAVGSRLLESAQIVMVEVLKAEDEIRAFAQGRRAVVRLSTECYTCYHWLPRVLTPFAATHPEVDIQILPEATRRPIEALLDGRIDLGILFSTGEDARLTYFPLFRDELVLVTAPEHRLANRPFIEAADLAQEHLITYDVSPRKDPIFQRFLTPGGVNPRRVSQMQLTEATIEMVKAGLGVAVLAQWAVAPQVAAGTLRATRLTRGGFRRQWRAAVPRQATVPKYLRELVQLLRAVPEVQELDT